jgi:AraC-like DNA-binding protein
MSEISSSRFSTEDFAPGERVAVWRETYGRTVAKLDLEPLSEEPFKADAKLHAFNGLGLVTMATGKLKFAKPSSLIDSDDLILVTVESGGWAATQLGREACLGPGEASICWNAEIAAGTTWGKRSMIRVPTKAIRPLVGDITAGVSRRIPAGNEALKLLRSYASALQEGAIACEVQRVATTHVYDLFGLLLGTKRESTEIARGRGARAGRLKAIKDDIAARIGETDLDACGIAQRHRLSVRYLHRLFEEDGLVFGQFVLGLRLACAERMLTDSRYAGRSISTIGYDAGFGDLSYFYRCFRRQYGCTPSEARAAASGSEIAGD